MRLLDARKLELVDVRDDAVPPYAILSHTWGDEELTLQDLQHMKSRVPQPLDKRKRKIADKNGFVKVKDAANQALLQGLGYIWIDTCCIDKTSSAELSEAINSMYQWYHQAAECFAILTDVTPAKKEDWAAPESTFRRSRWFTRGWTLQELVAPQVVHFFAQDWSHIGSKGDDPAFTHVVSDITGIDIEILNGRIDPTQLSVAARMQWAAHRQTTRLEDAAYSLMGLFRVNMPLLYGEGIRAFERLQEEIIQNTDDASIYAWNAVGEDEDDPDALYGLLAQSPAQFQFCGGIQALPPSPIFASAPSGKTNHGLRVQLYLRPVATMDQNPMEEDYWAILDCLVRTGDVLECPCIKIRRLSEDQYGRLETKTQKRLPPSQSMFIPNEGYRTIFVRPQPVYYHLPEFRISPVYHDAQFFLKDIYPAGQWNPSTLTFRVKYARKVKAMGLFRFQNPFSDEDTVDVAIGLRRIDSMNWEAWCFQCRSKLGGNTLASALAALNERITGLVNLNVAMTSTTLQTAFGDDARLATAAIVEALPLQGRLYVSVSVNLKPEMEVVSIPDGIHVASHPGTKLFLSPSQTLRIPFLKEFQVRLLTSPWAMQDPMLLQEPHRPPGFEMAVRTKSNIGVQGMVRSAGADLRKFIDGVRAWTKGGEVEASTPEELTEELALALFEGKLERVQDALQREADIEATTDDPFGLKPLHWALIGRSPECIEKLIKSGARVDSVTRRGWNCLHIAAIFSVAQWRALSGNYAHAGESMLGEMVQGRSKDEGDTPIHLSAAYCMSFSRGNEFFDYLWKRSEAHTYHFVRNSRDETPLHRAAAFDNLAVVEYLVGICCSIETSRIDCVDRYGRSPLWHAAAAGSISSVKALASRSAEVNFADDLGLTPLHAACRGGHTEVVKALAQRHAAFGAQTGLLGLTPLHFAAMFDHVECLKVFLEPDNTRPFSLKTPLPALDKALHIATSCGALQCVRELCNGGASPAKKQPWYFKLEEALGLQYARPVDQELTALEIARMMQNTEIIECLESVQLVAVSPVFDGGVLQQQPPSPSRYLMSPAHQAMPGQTVQQRHNYAEASPYQFDEGYVDSKPPIPSPSVVVPTLPSTIPQQQPTVPQATGQSVTVPAYPTPSYYQYRAQTSQDPQYQKYPYAALQPMPYTSIDKSAVTPFSKGYYGSASASASYPPALYPVPPGYGSAPNPYGPSPNPEDPYPQPPQPYDPGRLPETKDYYGDAQYKYNPFSTEYAQSVHYPGSPGQSYTGLSNQKPHLETYQPQSVVGGVSPYPDPEYLNRFSLAPLSSTDPAQGQTKMNLFRMLGHLFGPAYLETAPETDPALLVMDPFAKRVVRVLPKVFQPSGRPPINAEQRPIFELSTTYQREPPTLSLPLPLPKDKPKDLASATASLPAMVSPRSESSMEVDQGSGAPSFPVTPVLSPGVTDII